MAMIDPQNPLRPPISQEPLTTEEIISVKSRCPELTKPWTPTPELLALLLAAKQNEPD
jgi:hypothetical protein